jgi:hypothetical protein
MPHAAKLVHWGGGDLEPHPCTTVRVRAKPLLLRSSPIHSCFRLRKMTLMIPLASKPTQITPCQRPLHAPIVMCMIDSAQSLLQTGRGRAIPMAGPPPQSR